LSTRAAYRVATRAAAIAARAANNEQQKDIGLAKK
jgi:hypothetical protein